MSKDLAGSALPARTPSGVLDFWKFELTRGIWCAAIGVVTVFWQRESTEALKLQVPVGTVEYLIAVYLIVFGIVQFGLGRRITGAMRLTVVVDAAVSIVLGAAAIACGVMGADVDQFHWVVFAWALIHGGLDITFAVLMRRRLKGSQDWMVSGALHVALAVVLGIFVHMEALTVMGLVGAVAVMSGVLFILGAVTARRLARKS
ncbi:hypothetical protein [Spelaeicoccus albus]|uniref:Uncharacterized membrane protein HdeD (DUF308 family) n=1 Tax=Spelaeicoccus albus TaxID=1280376 RepID=A0A7Z0AAC0_9MICO|nr:hypothetical protein [Spelaeicoccus albus]NYI66526.1 uncharacterized membrane protein HdeD (DUF308 family) [Spelaeicoccus albus]